MQALHPAVDTIIQKPRVIYEFPNKSRKRKISYIPKCLFSAEINPAFFTFLYVGELGS